MIIRALKNRFETRNLQSYIKLVNGIDTEKQLKEEPTCANDKTYDGKALSETDLTSIISRNEMHDELLRKYNLEKVAAGNTDFERTVNLLNWLTGNTCYCGITQRKVTDNSLDILDFSFGKPFKYAINCRAKAIALADCLVAAGIKAYPIILSSLKFNGCHLICHVYLGELGKWCAFDPSFGCYFTDENGSLLDVFEIRDLFIGGREPTVCGYNFNGTTECFDVYMNGFLKYCISNVCTWTDNSPDRRNGKSFSKKKIFNAKIPEV